MFKILPIRYGLEKKWGEKQKNKLVIQKNRSNQFYP